ncbi:antitoxin CptB [Jannaschia faecimaris]|uniref:FAD assembly factor SdhE n=1 Tax=Jannaschia faecimaris TaxID=1244108 RepID=A0A1H3TGJ4_9RHOB|nr:succinate dehydrogenase assembly factor 2 [Jannaschia faecimaris]SDZ49354.1 antitoxin CptB [Jannaschia faecimaris]
MNGLSEVDARRKRLKIRAWRRGIKEMDLILGGYADEKLSEMSDGELSLFEAMLGENDHDLYSWVTGQQEAPPRFGPLIQILGERAAGIRG